jgi:WD40 repeat protein
VSVPSPYFRLKLEKLFGKSLETLELQAEENSVVEINSSKKETITDSELLEKTTASSALKPLPDQVSDAHQPENILADVPVNSAKDILADDTKSPLLTHQKQRFSRRSILLMIGGAGLISIGGAWLIEISSRQNIATAHSSPTITTLYVYKPDGYNINYVAWSPRGTFLACANGDNTVQIPNAATGGVEMVYRKHTGYANCVPWSPDEAYVGSASSDATVQIWKPTTGEHFFTYTGHIGSVYCAIWSHSGARIASGGKDTKVQVWDPFNGHHITTYAGHTKAVWDTAWSPDKERGKSLP